jgi:hypothetical protein
MSEDRLQKLKYFRGALDSQDSILEQGIKTNSLTSISPAGARPIKHIFNEISTEFPGLILPFEYYGVPEVIRQQIAAARHKIQDEIEVLERDAYDEAHRNDLRVDISDARRLLKKRIEEVGSLLSSRGTGDSGFGFLLWRAKVERTLESIYVTPRNAQRCIGALDGPGSEETLELRHRITLAENFLCLLDEDLSVRKPTAPGSVEAHSTGSKIFLGHGGSLQWLEVKDFLETRLHLQTDEFNLEPAAGFSTVERLTAMLKVAQFAFLVMTGEDEQPDGRVRARENVVHEAGLFQGRLGFKRAIILLEEGCEEFSNKYGLTDIRFNKRHIVGCFENIRRTLEREGIIEKS